MANIKPEDNDSPIWQGYSLPASLPAPSQSQASMCGAGFPPASSATVSYHRQSESGYWPMNITSMQTKPPAVDMTGIFTASPPSLTTHNSYQSLKRTFQDAEESPHGGIVHDFKEEVTDLSKPSISQDHRLLSFCKRPERHTIIDSHGRTHRLELSAQIYGMFFLSEMSAPGREGALAQPELTCYRRNLFQIAGSVTTPRGSLSVIDERGKRYPVVSLEVAVSATESVDGLSVKLIVIPWKNPPPNSPETENGQEHEPRAIPLLPLDEGNLEVHGNLSIHPFNYRRLQFRIATANNGRRRELQQHFTLHLNAIATLVGGSRLNVCEASTAPIVVRGRSPRNFQTRKEIALVGSSSSRGGLPDLHVSTSVPPSVAPWSTPAGKLNSRPQMLEMPGSPFAFDPSNCVQLSPSQLRTSTFPAYLGTATRQPDYTTGSNTLTYPAATPTGLEYLQVSQPNASLAHSQSVPNTMLGRHPADRNERSSFQFNADTSSSVLPSQVPHQQYFFHQSPVSAGGINSNPRPAKSPRHVAPPKLSPGAMYSNFGARLSPSYSESNEPNETSQQKDTAYFPTLIPMPAWTAAPTTGMYSTMPQPTNATNAQHYQFPNNSYVKSENKPQNNFTWNER